MPKDVLKVLIPLLCEMEELGQELSVNEFVEACYRLYESLTLPDKNTLLNYGAGKGAHNKVPDENLKFCVSFFLCAKMTIQ